MPEGSYTMYQTRQGGIGGGIMTPPPGMPKQIINYILVNDLEPMVARIQSRGGQIVTPITDVPGAGSLVHFTDPSGNVLGLWKARMG